MLLVEAEAMAAAGDPDRADALMERVIESVGVDEAWRLRGVLAPGVADARLHAPNPASAQRRSAARPPRPRPRHSPERTAAAHARPRPRGSPTTPAARTRATASWASPCGSTRAWRRRRGLAEPTLGPQPPPDRLLLYGDLLRAAGRTQEASEAYDRAARAGA